MYVCMYTETESEETEIQKGIIIMHTLRILNKDGNSLSTKQMQVNILDMQMIRLPAAGRLVFQG